MQRTRERVYLSETFQLLTRITPVITLSFAYILLYTKSPFSWKYATRKEIALGSIKKGEKHVS